MTVVDYDFLLSECEKTATCGGCASFCPGFLSTLVVGVMAWANLWGVSFDRCFETTTGSSCSADGETIALVKSTSEHTSDWRSLYIHKRQLQRNTTTSAVFLADVSFRRDQIRFDKLKLVFRRSLRTARRRPNFAKPSCHLFMTKGDRENKEGASEN